MADTTNLASNRAETLEEDADTTTTVQEDSLALSDTYSDDIAKLQEELATLRSTVTTLLSEVRTGAAKTLKAASDVVAHQGTALASSASDRAHTLASELESLARRKPLSTIAGALVAGIIIGLMGRRRS
jgi:ElaB/YqjD/DUF883 family membrane-anchored ribosome-binding protein